jgi:hypothetical protein
LAIEQKVDLLFPSMKDLSYSLLLNVKFLLLSAVILVLLLLLRAQESNYKQRVIKWGLDGDKGSDVK